MSTQNYAGIDIAKRNFVIGIHGKDKTKTETTTPKALPIPSNTCTNTTSASSSWKALAVWKSR